MSFMDSLSSETERNNFMNCLTYVKKNWPLDSKDIQLKRAESVYAISQVFFDEILPNFVHDTLKPVWN
ncbi:MAG: hypothetical protein J5I47_07765 [Vicingus serpentipes]|nr:hypothetical protein [Vicingus serpentipes]